MQANAQGKHRVTILGVFFFTGGGHLDAVEVLSDYNLTDAGGCSPFKRLLKHYLTLLGVTWEVTHG